uniref:Bridge-like lipid transfer protein family member 1 N-terminal domain-containing protein n=1 Tax=Ditylenchus dipsaci TaxID=166011 RepID=A0A915E7L1_9BILA
MLLDTDENSGFSSNESSNDFNIDILQKIQSDIRSEWERPDEPGINFFLLLAALLLLVIWVVFISFFFSRLLGLLVGIGFQRFLKWSGVSNVSHLSIGSFSISILSGKVMIRNFLLITDDYTLRVNDGWQCMNVSRLHVSLNGVKVHVFNRIAVYQGIAKQTGLSSLFANLINSAATNATGKEGGTATSNNQSGKTTKNSEKLEMQLDAWWDKLWRLFGSIRFDISSGRFMAGNHLLPAAFALTFENFQSKILLTDPSNREEDRYMFRMRATVENVRASLVKSTDYSAIKAGAVREDPPRTMGEGFAMLQTAMVQLYYHQDLLGIVKDEVQSLTQKTPVWETVWRLDKNTVISYGPWADKQRALIYSFFFPSDYACSPRRVTEMPKKGERRVLLSHDVRVSLVRDATIDFWFMRNEELNAIHSRVKQGSSFEFYIPWTTTETGFTSTIRGSLLCLEATTSLPFREFIKCETLRFNVTSHYPRAYNHQQTWDLVFELHRFSTHLLWDHKRFIVDLINEWTRGEEVDLCKFIPAYGTSTSVWSTSLRLCCYSTRKTGSSETSENLQAAVVGSQLYMNFALVFTEFGAETTSFELDMKAEDQVAVRIHLPPGNTLEPIFAALVKSANTQLHMKPSSVFVSVANDETWIEIWRTESICMKCEYEYHEGSSSKFKSDIPLEWIQKCGYWWIRGTVVRSIAEVDSGAERQLFWVYDQISDVSKKPLYSANMNDHQ